ncbi:hypothetical protein KNP414_02858 [Paenibacillus mucilaginosus KNP414]|uniref:Uncharacterized protein n=1 Tax=Paenibacillus mucilaginosus (strain KNP414) TaxID=1036673 RepID=F8FD00_PAEMK|nr:hypothetical protein KNP414_02858 [Paenibacillus mucilaginosus KNP414]
MMQKLPFLSSFTSRQKSPRSAPVPGSKRRISQEAVEYVRGLTMERMNS